MSAGIQRFLSATGDGNVGYLIFRLGLGLGLLTHGYGKVFGGLPQFSSYVESLGLPLPAFLAFMGAMSECIGGLFLALGFLTRPSAFFIAVTMAVAAFVAHAGDPFALREKALLYLLGAVLCLFKGSGRYAVDSMIFGRH